jgi:acyl carrier protein
LEDRLLSDLRDVFRDVFNSPSMEIQPELAFSSIEDCDSLKRLELIVSVESAFQIQFTTSEAQRLHSVSTLLDLLRARLARRARGSRWPEVPSAE